MTLLVLFPILSTIGMVSFFVARLVNKKLAKTQNRFRIALTAITFVASFALIVVAITAIILSTVSFER